MSAALLPLAFQWHITDNCDQRCKHCYIFSKDPSKQLASMSFTQMEAVIENCFEFCERFERRPCFALTGGDPILHPEFWRLAELLKSRNQPFTIMGNPFHLTDEVCERLKDAGCERYQMSLDGLRETHDWFRKPSSFDCTLEKIKCLHHAGILSTIMTTVSSVNIGEILELIDVVVAHDVDVYAFARFCPGTETKRNGISPLEYRALLDTCWHKFAEYEEAGCRTGFDLKDHLWTLYRYEIGDFEMPKYAEQGIIYDGCNCGNCHMTILPNGDLYACRRLESKVGNVFEDRIADVWLGPMEEYRKYDAFEKCSKCELLPYCRGCPAVAYGATGSFYGVDPQCWKIIP